VAAPVAIAALSPIDRDAEIDALMREAYELAGQTYLAVDADLKAEKSLPEDEYERIAQHALFMEQRWKALAERVAEREVAT
jgi:predicted lysophospholipase L1 biosynthesis ABC-type transport system permease subunit